MSGSDIQKKESKNKNKSYITLQSVKNSCEKIEGEKNGVNKDTKEIKEYNIYESIISKDTGGIKESEVVKKEKKNKINETQEIKKNKGKKRTLENKKIKETNSTKENKEEKRAVESNKISQEVIENTNEVKKNTYDVAENVKNIVARMPPLKTNSVSQAINNHSKSSTEKSLVKNLTVSVELNRANNVDDESLKNLKVKQQKKKTESLSGNQSELSSSLSNISNNKLDNTTCIPQRQPDISTSQIQDKNVSGAEKRCLEHDVDFKISESFDKAKFDDSKLKKVAF